MLRVLQALAVLLLLLAAKPADAQRGSAERASAAEWRGRVSRSDAVAALQRQPSLVDEAISMLRPSDSREPSVYFVGFAGYAPADVFLREAAGARDVADRHLGTHGRSLLLANHRDTLDDLPIASTGTLDAVLERLGRVMKVDKDFLVLFLTSHGLAGQIAVWFPGFSLSQVTPALLAQSLARSGIRNRVIVLSACYSGSFIPAMRNPDTMIIAAARADRSSFGCNPQRDWTFFGDAFFNRALRQTASLPAAFEAARTTVGRWERQQRLTPSEPQVFIGEAIRPKLDRLARQIEASSTIAGN
jgi:hypothetical protein